jgi:hypothetical protein
MKTFKQIDIAISIALIIGFFIAAVIRQDETFIIGYFVTGGWQVISMIVHAAEGTFAGKGTMRYNYHWAVAGIISIALCAWATQIQPLLVIAFVMIAILVFIAPLMAICYSWLCWNEFSALRKREFIHLK